MQVLQDQPTSHLRSGDRLSAARPDGRPTDGAQASSALSELALARLLSEKALSNYPELARSRAVALLLVLRPEVTHVAVLVAMCASAANTLAERPDLRAARALTRYFPVESANFILASTRYRRLDQEREVSEALAAFNDALSAAMAASMEYTAARQTVADMAVVPTGELCAHWRAACRAARTVLSAIDAQISMFNPLTRAEDGDVLMKALEDAIRGAAPLRTLDGEFEMPGWVEQRRSSRLAVSCSASLMVGAQISSVEILDVSTGGVGIQMTGRLREGDNVVLKVGHIILAGTVVWRSAARAGIAFDQSLVDDSPAYRFLSGLGNRK